MIAHNDKSKIAPNYLGGLFLISICLLASACLPEDLLIDVAPAQPQLVIASQTLPGDILLVFVSRSFSALEGNEDSLSTAFAEGILVDSALVSISINGMIDTLTSLEDVPGVFVSQFNLPIDEGEIRLDVFDSLTGQSVHASTFALPQISPDTVRFLEDITQADTSHWIHYAFRDSQEIDNWYVINVFDPVVYAASFQENPLGLVGGDEWVFYEELISDQILTGEKVENTVMLDSRVLSDTVAFFMANVSEGYFRFLDARQRSNGLIASATSEPINFPSNVVGGLGYFAVQRPSIRLVPKSQR
ncbi:MAG: DUF4249 family protein [Bacteroidota bacterium]